MIGREYVCFAQVEVQSHTTDGQGWPRGWRCDGGEACRGALGGHSLNRRCPLVGNALPTASQGRRPAGGACAPYSVSGEEACWLGMRSLQRVRGGGLLVGQQAGLGVEPEVHGVAQEVGQPGRVHIRVPLAAPYTSKEFGQRQQVQRSGASGLIACSCNSQVQTAIGENKGMFVCVCVCMCVYVCVSHSCAPHAP